MVSRRRCIYAREMFAAVARDNAYRGAAKRGETFGNGTFRDRAAPGDETGRRRRRFQLNRRRAAGAGDFGRQVHFAHNHAAHSRRSCLNSGGRLGYHSRTRRAHYRYRCCALIFSCLVYGQSAGAHGDARGAHRWRNDAPADAAAGALLRRALPLPSAYRKRRRQAARRGMPRSLLARYAGDMARGAAEGDAANGGGTYTRR